MRRRHAAQACGAGMRVSSSRRASRTSPAYFPPSVAESEVRCRRDLLGASYRTGLVVLPGAFSCPLVRS